MFPRKKGKLENSNHSHPSDQQPSILNYSFRELVEEVLNETQPEFWGFR